MAATPPRVLRPVDLGHERTEAPGAGSAAGDGALEDPEDRERPGAGGLVRSAASNAGAAS